MAVSGVYTFDLTLNEIIEDAFDRLQIGADGETLTGDMQKRAKRSLNLMIKEWEQQGIHLWTYTEGSLFLQVGQPEYDFSTANVTNKFFETSTIAAAAATDTTITVDDTTEMVVGDNLGIILQDNNLQWTTISTLPGAGVVTFPDPLTDDVLSGAIVRNYRGTFVPVKRVLDVRRKETTDYEIPIVFESRKDYFNLPNKNQLGTPIQAYYQRGRDNGTMFLWSTPSSSASVINFTYERSIQIMVNLDDTFDFPEEWHEAVISNLSVKLIPKYGASPALIMELKESAARSLSLALNFDSAVYPVVMEMDRYG